MSTKAIYRVRSRHRGSEQEGLLVPLCFFKRRDRRQESFINKIVAVLSNDLWINAQASHSAVHGSLGHCGSQGRGNLVAHRLWNNLPRLSLTVAHQRG